MKMPCHAAALAACALIAVQPAAAENYRDDFNQQVRGAAFAGAAFSVPLGGRAGARRASANFQFSPSYRVGQGTRVGSGIELGMTLAGKPSLQIAGHKTGDVEKKLALKGSGKYLVIGGVLVLVVVILAAVAGAQPTPGPHKGAF